MSPKGAARRAPASSGTDVPFVGHELDRAAGVPPAQSNPADLAVCVVELAAALPDIAGARMWRLAGKRLTLWQQTGRLPPSDEFTAEKVFSNRPVTEADSARWACPLGENAQMLGVLEVFGAKPLSERTRSFLGVFSRMARLALATAEHQQAVEELSTIVEATKRLNSTLDLGELINIILQLAARLVGADRGTVFLVDRDRNEIWSLKGLGLEQHEIRLPIGRGIAGWVARHCETASLENVHGDPRFEPEVDRRLGYNTRTLLGLPIRNKDGDIVGVLELLNKKGGSFSAADERSIGHLLDHVALALENAQLHRESLTKQLMERDLELARSVQQGLLPEHPPRLEGFEIGVAYAPSQMVSGDYYDFVALNPQALLIVIADVEGKGVASALVMANLQATLRTLAAHVHALQHIVSSVNQMILADTRAQKYLSMFVGLLDHGNRAVHYINAGHVPPAVIRADGETLYLREGGMVVGVFPHVAYERGYLQLRPGDIVAGYSDGITEAMDVHGHEYGPGRLVDVVRHERTAPAEKIAETVLTEVDRFSRRGPHEDDRVILILKVL